MPELKTRLCTNCGKYPRKAYTDLCGRCWYESMMRFTQTHDPDDQDWEWAHCEECGSSLGSDGMCHNTLCGNSPDVGEDWE